MVLATHAVVGATVASFFPNNPILAFVFAFISHLLLDTIPHWEYEIFSLKKDPDNGLNNDMILGKKFIIDLIRIGTDALIGLAISLILFLYISHQTTLSIILIGVIAGILPDPLQFVYMKTKHKALHPLQKFHHKIHGKKLEIHPIIGASLQIMIVVIIFSVSLFLKK